MSTTNRENYNYWQDLGGTWEQVYADRMKSTVYYHLQEMTVVDYVTANRPASVLEVGMGVGRHVVNLRDVVDTYGFDQSPTMFEVVRKRSDPEWFASHCTLGEPTGRLPYADDQFDLVMTSEVLVHVHPDDLPGLLAELARVARWQVFHIEPSSPDLIVSADHGGCWYHDIPGTYRALGLACERLPAGYSTQEPFRVVLDRSRPVADLSPAALQVMRRMESELQPSLDELPELRLKAARVDALAEDRDRLWNEVQTWSGWADELRSELASARAEHATQIEGWDSWTKRLQSDVVAAQEWAEHLRVEAQALGEQLAQATAHSAMVEDQLHRQGSALLAAETYRAETEQRLADVSAELDRALSAVTELAPPAEAWERLSAARQRSRSFDLALRATGTRIQAFSAPAPVGLRRDEVGISAGPFGEVWLLDVVTDGVPRDLAALELPVGWQLADSEHSINGRAVVGDGRAAELVLTRIGDGTSLRMLRHPWSGTAKLRTADGDGVVELRHSGTEVVEVDRRGQPHLSDLGSLTGVRTDPVGNATELPAEQFWAEVRAARPAAIAVCHPDWRGIRSSMQNLFSYALLVEDAVSEDGGERLADVIEQQGICRVVTGGLPRTYRHLVAALHRRGIEVFVTWHGSFMQYGEPYNRASMSEMIELVRAGVVAKAGFVKVGMAEAYERRGIAAGTLLNYVRTPPEPPSAGGGGARPSIGIWSIAPVWRKIPYGMVAACAALHTPPRVFASGTDHALTDLADELGVDLTMLGGAVPQHQMGQWLARMDLNLYVTLSECAPMLPLESLAVGVPCLLGPNAHYFDEDEFLRSRLVVTEPDRHERIAAAMERALEEREEIVEHYRSVFYPAHAAAGRRSVLEFLGAPLDAAV